MQRFLKPLLAATMTAGLLAGSPQAHAADNYGRVEPLVYHTEVTQAPPASNAPATPRPEVPAHDDNAGGQVTGAIIGTMTTIIVGAAVCILSGGALCLFSM